MQASPNVPDLGPEVDDTPCAIPDNSFALKGKHVTLEGISRSHMRSLFQNLDLPANAHLFNYLPWTPPKDPDELWNLITSLQTERGFIVYTIKADKQNLTSQRSTKDSESNHTDVLGIICYLEIHNLHRDIEIGGVLFSTALQRTTAATETHYLLLKNVLEKSQALSKGTSPPYRRVTWKCNALNKASRKAAERLGYVYEGTFRKHLIVKGRNRDTTWLSIVDDEWPVAKLALEKWMAEGNFDAEGNQKVGLVELRRKIEG